MGLMLYSLRKQICLQNNLTDSTDCILSTHLLLNSAIACILLHLLFWCCGLGTVARRVSDVQINIWVTGSVLGCIYILYAFLIDKLTG